MIIHVVCDLSKPFAQLWEDCRQIRGSRGLANRVIGEIKRPHPGHEECARTVA